MPAELKAQMTASAKAMGRSLHAEIIARLEQTFSKAESKEVADASLAVRELDSLQRLGTLTYKLQRATYRADEQHTKLIQAHHFLQQAIQSGTPKEQVEKKAICLQAEAAMNHYHNEIQLIEKQISDIHFERQVLGFKELRDVQPLSGSAEISWGVTEVQQDKQDSKHS